MVFNKKSSKIGIIIGFIVSSQANTKRMTSFDKQKLTEIVLYILNKTKGLDYYHVFKVIYFANIAHLARYGFRMTTDEFCAVT